MAVSLNRGATVLHDQSGPDPEDLARLEPPTVDRTTWAAVGAIVFVAVLAIAAWWNADTGDAYETTPLVTGHLTQRVTAVGQLEPLDRVEIGSDLTGTVAEVVVDENQLVVRGQVLAKLDPGPFENAVTQSRASAASSRAQVLTSEVELERLQSELDRNERLFARGAATGVDVERSRLDVRAAQSSLQAARATLQQSLASLERTEQDLQDTVIAAPIDGVVVRRLVDEGQTVVSAMAATPLFEIASDLADLKVEVDVDEADVGLVNAGQQATFTVAAWPNRTFIATVAAVDLAADTSQSVVVYETELRVDNTDGALRPGMTATAEIQVGRVEDALLVPTHALRYRPDTHTPPPGDHLWTLDGTDLVAVPVRVGGSDGALTAVYSDSLSDGQVIVVGGGQ